ncbi:Fic family protein [Lysinibacillus fusiformis]|uniref:Fic/DOC family protein n=1 Tax=Lysinibacillus fusiformis TaxID=28031 RepID=UPI0011A87296|nr:Fic family protein [Lysinibacillus fusiformis]
MEKFNQSKYCYPNSIVLINKFNIHDQQKLDQLEALYVGKRLKELREEPLYGTFDFSHLKSIHRYIFQDIYDFAGDIRDENISKDHFQFANSLYIEDQGKTLFKELENEKFLEGLPLDQFCKRAAYFMAEINVLHPFREGNGRTQTEFIRLLAMKNGFELNWGKIEKEVYTRATILSKSDETELSEVIYKCIANHEPKKEIIHSFAKGLKFRVQQLKGKIERHNLDR